MKKIGVEPWANSYVIISKGKKRILYYVHEKELEIRQMEEKERWIRLTISGPENYTINIRNEDGVIETFGKC